MARIPDIERGLLNWARWRAQMQDGGGNFARVDFTAERVDGGGWDTPTPIPTNDAEAELYDKAVKALASELRQTVEMVYIKGGGMRDKARRLAVSEATVYMRIDKAHIAISSWLRDHKQAQDDQRKRMEALQRSARQF